MKNRFAERCDTCKELVAPEAGYKERQDYKWVTLHLDCKNKV